MPRTWTDEQKKAAADRMRATQQKRWAQKQYAEALAAETQVAVQVESTRPPEVQAVIDSMDPKRRAKLAGVQNRVWQDNGRADGKAAQEALARFQAEKSGGVATEPVPVTVASNAVLPDAFHAMAQQTSPQRDQQRIGSREVNLIVRTDGTMVSQLGPCVCGRPKREWHAICCKP